jgi:hypothetical protein
MKALFLTTIAALFLATGTANAYPPRYYDCGKAFVKIQTGAGSIPGSHRVFPTTWTVAENYEVTQNPDRTRDATELRSINLRCIQVKDKWIDKCSLNGKLCRKMSDEEGRKEFGDED